MRVYIVDNLLLSLQAQAAADGHKVHVHVDGLPKLDPSAFACIPRKPENLIQEMSVTNMLLKASKDPKSLVIVTDPESWAMAQAYGCLDVVGGDYQALMLESDRAYAHSVFRAISQDLPASVVEQHVFTDAASASKKLKKGRWVLKLSDASPDPLIGGIATCIVSTEKQREEALAELQMPTNRWFKEGVGGVVLEEFIEGREIAFSAFFDGRSFVLPYMMNVEQKDAQTGNKTGVMTGEVGSTLEWGTAFHHDSDTVTKLFTRLAPHMADHYAGMVDMNFLWDGQALRFLEFTVRFGRPTLEMQTSLLPDLVSQMKNALQLSRLGITGFSFTRAQWSTSVGITLYHYGYPSLQEEAARHKFQIKEPVFDVPDPQVFSVDGRVQWVPFFAQYRDGRWKGISSEGRYITVVGSSDSIEEAAALAYSDIQARWMPRKVSGITWRDDVGVSHAKTVGQLIEAGVIV